MKQKNEQYIRENMGKKSVKQIARDLNMPEKSIRKFLREASQRDTLAKDEAPDPPLPEDTVPQTAGPSFLPVALAAALIFMISIFLFSLFKNIQYPLLWNDESETAMYAKRIVEYGYPKIHDGKNIVWQCELPDKRLGIDEKRDSCSALVWGQYYFAAIGELFARKTGDLYLKTALLRIPFALAGFLGLCIMALAVMPLFGCDKIRARLFLILFFFFETLSVTLTLHLREVRHPSLVVFLTGCLLWSYLNHRFYRRIGARTYFLTFSTALFCLYHVLHLACFIFFIAIFLYEGVIFIKEKSVKGFLVGVSPVLAAAAAVMPFFFLSQTYTFGKAYRDFFFSKGNMPSLQDHVADFLLYFQRFEFLYLAVAAKIMMFCGIYLLKRQKRSIASVEPSLRVSNFLLFFWTVYGLMMLQFPSTVIFVRYYIVLQPLLMMMTLLDILSTFRLLSQMVDRTARKWGAALCVLALFSAGFLNKADKLDQLKGHMYELSHVYQGPLDYVMPYLQSHFKAPEKLVIATNYEEHTYMYYLGSKVIGGYVGNNLDEDATYRPDVIVFRKKGTYVEPEFFEKFFEKGSYQKVSFPVEDYPVNNIPESHNRFIAHLFKTPLTDDERQRLEIYILDGAG